MKLIRQMSVTAVMLALGLAASASQHLSTRFPDSKPQARTYNLLADEAALFKTPRMGMVVNLSEEGRLESPASNVRPPMAVAPPPGYNVRLQGCNLRPAGTDATSVVIFRAHPDHGMTAVVSGDQFRANGGGCYVGDNFYYIGYTQMFGMNLASFYHYNATTWEAVAVKDAPEGCISYDMTYDATDGKIYGAFYNDDMNGFVFGTFDPVTVKRTPIAALPCEYFAIAASPEGVIYGIDEDGNLNTIDKVTGAITLVGPTGVKPKFKQSADFDDSTGRLYWAAIRPDQSTSFYEVDVNTGAATKIFDFAMEDQVTALNVLAPETVAGAPNTAEGFRLDFAGGALEGTAAFTAPDHTYGGNPLTGSLTYELRVDGQVYDSGQIAKGASKSVNVSVGTAGFHTVGVVTSNAAGMSPVSEIRRWFGADTPRGVENLSLTSDDDNLLLSWDAPSEGVNGGWINTAGLRYTVVRQPAGVVVADKQAGTTFSEPYGKDGISSYYYDVTVYDGSVAGEAVSSNKLLAGGAFPIPYFENFDNPAAADLYTVIDVSADKKTWQYTYDEDEFMGDMRCTYSGTNPKDDWLISPPLKLEAGKLYNISMLVMARGSFRYPEKMSVVLSASPTLEGMTTGVVATVVPETEYTNRVFDPVSGMVQVPADGTYYVGIHAASDAAMDVLAIDNLAVEAESGMSAPAAVTNLTATPDADGSLGVSLSFTTPLKTIGGDDLAGLDKVELYRGDDLIRRWKPVGCGEVCTHHDGSPQAGMNTYQVRAFYNDQRGLAATVQAFAGKDVPGLPRNVRITENDGVVSLTWEAPAAGANGGVVDTESMTYLVIDSEGEVIKTDIAETRWDFVPKIPNGQDLYAWSVAAQNQQGMGNSARSNILALGEPFGVPFTESFINAVNQTSPWGQYLSGMGGRWFTSDTGLSPLATPQDKDGGLLTFIPSADNDEAMIYSGKIDVSQTNAPVVDFWYYYASGMAGNLSLEVSANHGAFATVGSVDYSKAHEGWNFIRMPLSAVDCSGFVQIGLRASTGSIGRHIHIDNIALRDPAPHDLAALDVTAPAEIKVGTETTVTATVMNVGTQAATGYTVELWVNGMHLQTIDGTEVQPLATASFDFKVTPTVAMSTKAAFGMKIVYSADKNLADNTLIAGKVNVEMPVWPVVSDLSGSYDGANVNLEWSAMEDAVVDPQPVTDRFESYEPFIIDNIGDWTVVDVDGGSGTYKINNTSSTSVEYANAGKPMAFQVFNPSQAGLLLVNGEGIPTGWMPHSGSQMLAAFGDIDGQNDDWLISPELSGDAQTVTFFARSYSDMYGLETIEVLTSATDREISSFERVKGIASQVPAAWTQYNVSIPQGTKFFAIRCTSTKRFVLLVDDISYVPAGAEPTPVSVTGYNVYRNGVKLTEQPVAEPRFSEPYAPNQAPKYAVTAVYDKGESNFSNIVTVATVGIFDVDATGFKVISDTGRLVIEGAEGLSIAVTRADGATVWAGTPGSDSMSLPLPAGVYVVAAPGTAVKAFVK